MKKIILVAFTLALLTSGCKVFKSSKKSQAATPKTETSADTKVFSVPAPTGVRDNPTSDTMYAPADKPVEGTVTGKPVSVRSENFTLTSEDQAAYGSKKFFVIVGSFSSNENAGKFKQDLTQQGFKPIILHSETGYYRVCVDSFNDEAAARNRVQGIRTQYPKYADSWLLIRK
ncbi:MAG TPA: SPOR domain-containing protein [Prolixibacteraceae bacterium]|jgi:cell division protein FtsN